MFFESAIFERFPLLSRLAGQVTRQRFDGNAICGAELTPQQKARVVLPRLVRNFIRQILTLSLFILTQLVIPRSL
jgi:hypothetical protein